MQDVDEGIARDADAVRTAVVAARAGLVDRELIAEVVVLASGFFRQSLGPLDRHTVSGNMVAYRDERTAVYPATGSKPLLTAAFPADEQLNFRSHSNTVTLWDSHGRLVAADIGQSRALASFALSPS